MMTTSKDIASTGSPMLYQGGYIQWAQRVIKFIDKKPNEELLLNSILKGPYKLVDGTTDPHTHSSTRFETLANLTKEEKEQVQTDKQVINIIFLGVDNDVFSTIESCESAHEMWLAIE
ncbi:hypothetical protein Tco_0740407 [Tanacetum coccineum]